MLESEVFHEHFDMSGIMLKDNSSLAPVQAPVQRLDVLRRSMTDDLRFDGINTLLSSRAPPVSLSAL